MKAPPFRFVSASSVDEAVAHLGQHGDEAKLLAGGQSLVPLLNLRLAYPEILIDIAGIPELQETTVSEDGSVRLGAGVTHSNIEDGRTPDPTHGLLPLVAAGIGYRPIRNRGTLGGSLAHADPSAEWPLVMAALGAMTMVRSPRGERTIPAQQLFKGFLQTALEPDEVMLSVELPPLGDDVQAGYYKSARKRGEFADSLAVVILRTSPDGVIREANVWVAAAAPTPLRLTAVEQLLEGERWTADLRLHVRETAARSLESDGADENRFQANLHGVSVCRALDMTSG